MTTSVSPDHAWLRESIDLATRNVAAGGGPFGAVVIRAGEVIATGTNQVTPTLDPTAHAEVVAIREAARSRGEWRLDGCTLVVTLEPCTMCAGAVGLARVDRLVFGAFDDREFYELFGRPRETWSLPVRQVCTGEDTAPFTAWLARTDRVDY